MDKPKNLLNIFLLIFIISGFHSCMPGEADTTPADSLETSDDHTEIQIEAEKFTNTSSEMKVEGGKYVLTPNEDSWIAFEVNIEEAGRYQFQLNAACSSDSAFAWIEDYTDNKDGRTYNITGDMPIAKSDSFTISSKDGSPLNQGLHKMKLHLKGGMVMVDWIKFTLLRKHQPTPKNLTQKTDGQEWKVVWSDEFNGEGSPDTSKWTFDIGDWGWGNNELQYYTENRLENARQENGNLVIEARKNDGPHAWTSARLTTRGKVSFTYGRIEFRAKVPPLRGNWAAGWTLGDSYVDELSWPYCGEIDILESVGYEIDDATGDGKAHASVHCGAYYFKLGNHHTGTLDVPNISNDFHLYAVDWTPAGMTATVDGQAYFSYQDTSTELSWPFDKAQNIILNLAMGGGWGGQQGIDETINTQQFLIDYVRVYEKQ